MSPGYAPCTPLGFSRGLEEAAGHPTHTLPKQPYCRAPLPRCWGPEHQAHPPPPAHQQENRNLMETKGVQLCPNPVP